MTGGSSWAASGQGAGQQLRERTHVLSGKFPWRVKIGFCSLGPFCHCSSARKTSRYHWRIGGNPSSLTRHRTSTTLSGRVERACLHGKEYVECKWRMGHMERNHVKMKRSRSVTLGTRGSSISVLSQGSQA